MSTERASSLLLSPSSLLMNTALSALLGGVLSIGCSPVELEGTGSAQGAQGLASDPLWLQRLPQGFPRPSLPPEAVISDAHVELGRHLFYDERLSGNGTQACASCHEQARAFSDGRRVAEGSTGELTPRNAMALVNVAYNSAFNWANPSLAHLEEQVVIPMFGERPVEMGVTGHEGVILERLEADEAYQELFARAYPDEEEPISFHNIVGSLSAFTRSLISGGSPFDRFVYQGERGVLSASALRGMDLFFSEELECHHCHGGFNFSFSTTHEQSQGASLTVAFHNTGLYNLNGAGEAPMGSQGVFEVSGDPQDMGKFRAPTLRNIEVTAPYMHDGSMTTLEEVVRFYEAGGRVITEGPHAGDGRESPLKSEFVSGFTLTDQERADLIEFLRSLTDEAFLSDERLADPWRE